MKILLLATIVSAWVPAALLGDVDTTELYYCSFIAHTPAGTITGACTTQSVPAEGYVSRWKFTVTPDARSTNAAEQLSPDVFFDAVRSQCVEDGTFTLDIPLWGDFVVTPFDAEYLQFDQACVPQYQILPHLVTFTQVSTNPRTFQFLFEVRNMDYAADQGLPTIDWVLGYLESFRRLRGPLAAQQ